MPDTAVTAVRLIVVLLAMVALTTAVARRVRLPESVALVFVGILVAAALPRVPVEITPELVLLVLVPGLVFEAAYGIDWAELRPLLGIVALLAVPGVLISAAITAYALHLGIGLPLALGLIVGAAVAATDPVAVIATFARLEAPRQLRVIVESESLLNDGTALVLFGLAVAAQRAPTLWTEGIAKFAIAVVVSTAIGIATGATGARLIAAAQDRAVELSVSAVVAYGSYLAADALGLSGVIATVVTGITLGTVLRRRAIATEIEATIETVWAYVAFVLTATAFLIIGFQVGLVGVLVAVLPIAFGVAAIASARALTVFGVLGALIRLERVTRDVPARWLPTIFWAGLRGAIATAAALALPLDLPERVLLQRIIFGVVFVTLVIQGTSASVIVRRTVQRGA